MWHSAAARLALFAAGVALVVVPMLLTFVYLAGAEPEHAAQCIFSLPMHPWLSDREVDRVIAAVRAFAE